MKDRNSVGCISFFLFVSGKKKDTKNKVDRQAQPSVHRTRSFKGLPQTCTTRQFNSSNVQVLSHHRIWLQLVAVPIPELRPHLHFFHFVPLLYWNRCKHDFFFFIVSFIPRIAEILIHTPLNGTYGVTWPVHFKCNCRVMFRPRRKWNIFVSGWQQWHQQPWQLKSSSKSGLLGRDFSYSSCDSHCSVGTPANHNCTLWKFACKLQLMMWRRCWFLREAHWIESGWPFSPPLISSYSKTREDTASGVPPCLCWKAENLIQNNRVNAR